jgi:adenine-specific DNA-methyltransferase
MQETSQLLLLASNNTRPDISEDFSEESRIVVHTCIAYKFMQSVPPNVATLVITSTPYNVGKAYETRQSIE